MKIRSFVAFARLMIAMALLTSGAGVGSAQKKDPPGQTNKRITHADRQAAAQRAAALGFNASAGTAAAPGQTPRYYSHPNYANSPLPEYGPLSAGFGPGIRKFVDTLPGLGSSNKNNLDQYIPVAIPDTQTYPGSDYYEIGLVQYREKMHSDLPGTLLRGYVQLSTSRVPGEQIALTNALLNGTTVPVAGGYKGVAPPHYLGPMIIAQKNRPVRILFRNLLPTTPNGGNLFVPVDTTVMGSGMAPGAYGMTVMDPQNPLCSVADPVTKAGLVAAGQCYAENRAVIHLHGGISPWISDGTPHQWIVPAGENTPYKEGDSVEMVPDMWFDAAGNTIASCAGQTTCAVAGATNKPGLGAQTYYYTNQQSARLMFYHDHAWGITRLNVYVGEAAGYLITDPTEQALLAGPLAGLGYGIPLIIQDKTFVPNAAQLADYDETWDVSRWGGEGNLWLPHVYSPAQNPGDPQGVNPYGRWMYGPWFWPPTLGIEYGPIPNPYYDPNCDPNVQWCEPPLIPGTPYNSMGMEAFHDTPVVNGTAYPVLEVDPKTYRFRILNAANDRFFNLSLYQADPNAPTEVALNAAEVAAAKNDPFVVFPTPDEAISPKGPDWIMIGTEGGFLPAPVVIPAQPTTWVTDPTVFNAGNVDKHSLLLGPAERADVIVDFSRYAGKTLILYNDAPAAFPARDPRYDYYTDSADLTAEGGVPPIQPGYGPNTRTVMQIKVRDAAPAAPFDLAPLDTAFKAKSLGGGGVFESGQHPIIVGQQAYNSAYGTNFAVGDGLVQIFETSKTFPTVAGVMLTFPLQPKQIQDEMGEAFEHEYGRMSGFLGVETPNAQAGLQNMILYPLTFPPTEIIKGVVVPYDAAKGGLQVAPISTNNDGTQIWKITHNGVDTHPIHFHLYEVQLVNRVGWDGIIRKPHPSELGWKDTVRISPLEDTIVALRPVIPSLPWDLPNSVRLLDPSKPEGAYLANTTAQEAAGLPIFAFDPNGEPIDVINHMVNFGWEYVWHCHILSHEEMDMMRPQVVGVPPIAPSNLTVSVQGGRATLRWSDNSKNETGFKLQRASDPTFATGFVEFNLPQNATSYVDTTVQNNRNYFYRIFAVNLIGDTWDYSNPNLNEGAGFPTMAIVSGFSNVATVGGTPPPGAPTNLSATVQAGPQISLTWTDNATNETGFAVERCTGAGCTNFSLLAAPGPRNSTGSVTYVDTTVAAGNTYSYRVKALNAGGESGYTNTATATVPLAPAAPTGVTVSATVRNNSFANVTLNWTHSGVNVTGFTIQRATNAAFTQGLQTYTATAASTTWTQNNAARGTTYYFRIRADGLGGSSAWVNAAPFPITTP